MKRKARMASLAAGVLFAAVGCSTLHKTNADSLQGTWRGHEIGNAPETPRELIISGTRVEYRGAHPQDWGKGTFSLREDTQPKQLIVALEECGFPQYVGKTAFLIYKLEDGTLTAAANEPGSPAAPLSFDAAHARRMIFRKE